MSLRQPDDPHRLSPHSVGSQGRAEACVASLRIEVPEFRVRRSERLGEADLVWSVLPEVAMLLIGASAASGRGPIQALDSLTRNFARALAPTAGPTLTRVGSVLVVDTSVQTERATSPLVHELALRYGEPTECRLPPLGARSMAAAGRSVHRVGKVLREALSAAGIDEPPGLHRELLKVEILRHRAREARLRDAGIDAVVVGSQQNSSARSVLSVARGEGVASFYLPHAPTADNAFYHDLPTTHALLRGPAEVDFYAGIGVGQTGRLMVVGNPGAAQLPGEEPPPAQDLVYAASTHSEAVLRADVEVIRAGTDQPVIVCLHPRMHAADVAGLLPSNWRIVGAPNTDAYLRTHGARVVIQHGSGVGLEALFLGIEVIDLCHAAETPNYPYIRPPHIQIAHDAHGLSTALDAIPGRADQRAERIAFAHSWCRDVGVEAARSCADAIDRTRTAAVPRDVLFDGWGRYLSDP